MRSKRFIVAGIILVAAAASLGAGSSAGRPDVKIISRWAVDARVANGSQILSRISNSSTPEHKGNGDVDSWWHAKWKVRLKIIDREVYIVGANASQVGGAASGEYRGRYPKSQTETAHFTCPYGPIHPPKVLKHLRIYGNGRTDGKVTVNIGVDGEPGVLPALKCNGDKIDVGTPKTLSAGVLTGIESACFGNVPAPGVKLKKRKAFTVKKKFGWDPPSPSGYSRPCSGFGFPITSAGFGTIKLVFTPIQ